MSSLILQILHAEQPEEVKERIHKQVKALRDKARRESPRVRAKTNAARRKKYQEDEAHREKIKAYRKAWWASKTEEERKEIYAKAKIHRIAGEARRDPAELERRDALALQRRKEKYKNDPVYREARKASQRERSMAHSEERRAEERQRRKNIMATISEEEYERRRALARERCRRYRAKKKMKSIANGKGDNDGDQQKHSPDV